MKLTEGSRVFEQAESRVLGAVQFSDAVTGARVTSPLRVSGSGADFIKNRSHQYVIAQLGELESHEHSFVEPPEQPPVESLDIEFQVVDPTGRYLPRIFNVALPRDPEPSHREYDTSLFRAVDCTLYRDVNAKTLVNWSLLRVSASDVNGEPLVGGFLRCVRSRDDNRLAESFTNCHGEALLIVSGIPITQFSTADDGDDDAPVLVNDVQARVELSVPSNTGRWPVNPDELAQSHDVNRVITNPIKLQTGRTEVLRFDLSAS